MGCADMTESECWEMQRVGRVHAAAFSDEVLYAEMVNKAAFWAQSGYFGIDLTPLYAPALAGYFAQVGTCLSDCSLSLDSRRGWLLSETGG